MKKLKYLTLIALAAFFGTTCNVDKVNAEEQVCKQHTYYYLFSEINSTEIYNTDVYTTNGTWERRHNTSFLNEIPNHLSLNETPNGQIELVKDGNVETNEQWSLSTYAKNYKLAKKNLNENSQDYGGFYEAVNNDKEVIRYYLHGDWSSSGGAVSTRNVDYSNVSVDDIVKGSIITKTEIDLGRSNTNTMPGNITRHITPQEASAATAFNLNWETGSITGDGLVASKLTPAVYYYTFKLCGDTYYDVIVHYYLKGTTEKVADDYLLASNLSNGASDEYDCPPIDGYTLNTTDTLQYVINSADAELICEYTVATGSNATENVETADFLIWIAWGIGAAAIVFAIWYYVKYYRNPNNTTKKVK